MTNENDLIRREDALAACDANPKFASAAKQAIAALPAAPQTGGWGGVAENVRTGGWGGITALPAAPMGVRVGEIERIVWDAMIWAYKNHRFVGATEYTDNGNSFAEEEARAAARDILAALTPQPATKLRDALELPEIREALAILQQIGFEIVVELNGEPNAAYPETRAMLARINAALAALTGGA